MKRKLTMLIIVLAVLAITSMAPAAFIEFESAKPGLFSGTLSQNGSTVTLSVTNHGKAHLTAFEVAGFQSMMVGGTNPYFQQTQWNLAASVEPLLVFGSGKPTAPWGLLKPEGIKQHETAHFVFVLLSNPQSIIVDDLEMTMWQGYGNPKPLSAETTIIPVEGSITLFALAMLLLLGYRRRGY